MITVRFTKMQGAANDFIVIDNRTTRYPASTLSKMAAQLCPRRFAAGADGFMAVSEAQGDGDFRMEFFNADGSIGEMCGNGARCIARYGFEMGMAGEQMRIETTAGPVKAWRLTETDYKVRINDVTAMRSDMSLEVDGTAYPCAYVELGHPALPHLAVPYQGLRETSMEALRPLGRALRSHSALPKGANVNFYEITETGTVFIRTFERGVEDFTYACGTGTASVAAVLASTGLQQSTLVTADMAGGRLQVEVTKEDGRITDLFLIGPARIVYEATAEVEI